MTAVEIGCAVLAGSAGAVTRLVVDGALARRWPGLPVATLLINLTGSLLLGLLTGLVAAGAAPHELTAIAGTGFCGGYTTFSTASVEAVRLYLAGRRALAAGYAFGTPLLAVAAAAAGFALAW